MDAILSAHEALEKKSNLSKAVSDVQILIDQLQQARDAVAESPELTVMHMAKLKHPVKASFDRIEDDLKEVNKGLNQYQKALKDKFKGTLPGTDGGAAGGMAGETGLVNRAIAMHLLREGKFGVAATFVREVNERAAEEADGDVNMDSAEGDRNVGGLWMGDAWQRDFPGDVDAMDEDGVGAKVGSGNLQKKFTEMYTILDALRNQHDLEPAIAWARANSSELETRGSNLEFELARLKFIELYTSSPSSPNGEDTTFTGPLLALDYARQTFPAFSARYSRETSTLLGSLAFSTSLDNSPYTTFFTSPATYYDSVSTTFTAEFCSLLGLSSTSPLYTAVTAGGISLPILSKLEKILTTSRGQWTSVNELPVETPLPPAMRFHSVFVCPVSKEQATDANPPMMLPCGHVIAKESLEMHARGKTRMKCPYCPVEFGRGEGKRVYI